MRPYCARQCSREEKQTLHCASATHTNETNNSDSVKMATDWEVIVDVRAPTAGVAGGVGHKPQTQQEDGNIDVVVQCSSFGRPKRWRGTEVKHASGIRDPGRNMADHQPTNPPPALRIPSPMGTGTGATWPTGVRGVDTFAKAPQSAAAGCGTMYTKLV